MAKWTDNVWTPIEQINDNNKYNENDGITLSDINTIMNNIFYKKGN